MKAGRLRLQTVAAGVSLTLLVMASPASAQLEVVPNPWEGCSASEIDDACEVWTTTYHDAEAAVDSSQSPSGVAVSPDGRTVFEAVKTTTGVGFDSRATWAMLAYDSQTGAPLWTSKWGDPDRYSFPTGIVASHDLVIVTGSTRATFNDPDSILTTMALDPATGETVWTSTYNYSGGLDNSRTLVLSRDGRTVYIAGISAGTGNPDLDYALIAYDTLTGAERFVTRYDGIGVNGSDSPFGLVVSPDGKLAFLTGWSDGPGEFNVDFGTIAVHTAGDQVGEIAWEARYDGTSSRAPDQANGIAISHDGSKVFVTGLSSNVTSGPPFSVDYSYATVAYDARSGAPLWEARTKWDGTNFNSPTAIATDRLGRVFVTGQSRMATGGDNNVGTAAYDGNTGEQLWADRYGLSEHDLELGRAIAVSPRGDGVYVTGISSSSRTKQVYLNQTQNGDQLTLGYDPASGQRSFTARYNATGYDYDVGHDAVVSPDGSMLYLTSALKHNIDMDSNFYDAGLVSYSVGPSTPPPPDREPSTLRFTDASATTATYSDEMVLEALLTDENDEPLAGQTVTFTIGGAGGRTLEGETDATGTVRVNTVASETPGGYPVRASFAGSDGFEPSEIERDLVIERETTTLTLSVSGSGSHKTLTARLTDEDDPSGIADRTISFMSEGEALGQAVTDGSGLATFEVPPRSRGARETFDAIFSGDAFYLGAEAHFEQTKPWV